MNTQHTNKNAQSTFYLLSTKKNDLQQLFVKPLFIVIQTLMFIWLLISSPSLSAQITELECSDTWSSRELITRLIKIPQTNSISLFLKGGDGGGVGLTGGCGGAGGGEGASVEIDFLVSETGEALRPGGLLKVYVGQGGRSGDIFCSNPESVSGGGGGSSAVLYQPPGGDPINDAWIILAVAGGGGGAVRPLPSIKRDGQGGRSSIDGGNSGNFFGGRLVQGACPGSSAFEFIPTGFGGGIPCNSSGDHDGKRINYKYESLPGYGITVHLIPPINAGSNKIDWALLSGGSNGEQSDGGNGFTGGGSGGGGGGGGGGITGGATRVTWPGGGGGSYGNPEFGAHNVQITAGKTGAADFLDDEGLVTIIPNGGQVQALCKATATVPLDGNGNGQLSISDVDDGSNDNCGTVQLGLSQTDFTCDDIGEEHTVTLTVNGSEGQTSTCTSVVTVIDDIPPVAKCGEIIVWLPDIEAAKKRLEHIVAGSFDNCGIKNITTDFEDLPFYEECDYVRTYPFTVTVQDFSGNEHSCIASATIIDDAPPVPICQDVTVELDENGTATVMASEFDNGSYDNCSEVIFSFSNKSKTLEVDCKVGNSIPITLRLMDINRNISTCKQTLFIKGDNIPPVAKCEDFTIELGPNGEASINQLYRIDAGSYDNCGIKNTTIDSWNFPPLKCSAIGTYPLTLTVEDFSGNEHSCTAQVTIKDGSVPTVICEDVTIKLDENGHAVVNANRFGKGSYDNCTTVTYNFPDGSEELEVDCNAGSSIPITIHVNDRNGNTSTCEQTLFIVDNIQPTAKCKTTHSVQIDENGEAKITAQELDNGSTDNCGSVEFEFFDGSTELDVPCFTGGLGYQATLYVKDGKGNQSTCISTINPIDNIPPVAKCKDVTVELDESGFWAYETRGIDNGSYDNCGLISSTSFGVLVTCSDIGTIPLRLDVEDFAGNKSSCTGKVIIVDRIAPVARCKDVTVTLDASGQAKVTVQDIDNGSSDACGIAELSLDKTTLTCSDNSVWLKVIDNNGNVGFCRSNVTFVDDIPPVAKCKDITVELDKNGESVYFIGAIDNGSYDNCRLQFFNTSLYVMTCNDIGTVSKTLNLKDYAGNKSSCTGDVTVVDRIAPVARCQDVTVTLGDSGQGMITAQVVDDGSSDACGIKSLTLDKTTVTCEDQSVILTVTDNHNNSSTCSANLFIDDQTAPIPDQASLPIIKAECSVSLSSAPTAIDNCEGTIIGTTSDPLSYSTQGTHTITWVFDDGNGNSFTQTQTVIIDDVTAPVPDLAILPIVYGLCEVGLEPPFATDNCVGQVTGTTSDPLYFDKEGTYTVTWVFDDGHGNTSSQDQTIVIEDDVAPVPDQESLPSLRAQCGLTVSKTPTATDRCGGTIQGTTSDPLTYNTQGVHIITWVFDDGNGNTSSQTQRVVIRDRQVPVPDQASLPTLRGSCLLKVTKFPTATDNCAGSITATTDSPLEFDQEGTFVILWNYNDGNGNTSTQSQWVVVENEAAPNALCKNISVPLQNNGTVRILAADIDNGSFDDCSSISLLISPEGSIFGTSLPPAAHIELYCKDGKEQALLLSVTNENGKSAYCQAKVTLTGTDSDNDGLLDSCDNCPDTYNSDQKDSNNNGIGDACEEASNPDPGGWGGWSLKKQSEEESNIVTQLKAYPNPFQKEINLSFNLSQEEKTTLEVFNIQGQRVHTLLSNVIPEGEHRVLWDGTDQNQQSLPAGIYLIRLRAGKALINQKVILQK